MGQEKRGVVGGTSTNSICDSKDYVFFRIIRGWLGCIFVSIGLNLLVVGVRSMHMDCN